MRQMLSGHAKHAQSSARCCQDRPDTHQAVLFIPAHFNALKKIWSLTTNLFSAQLLVKRADRHAALRAARYDESIGKI